ncbi:MAG: tRNA pseudouridine(55) synthase TruB [Patescibacteria group bacterium]|nr:tRNA pseudouridine(55) synthase TruB [Patescibacteria group bacterium]
MQNVFAIYKPKGPSSNRVLQYIKRESGIKKIGHGGTLDPLASGVLVVGVNEGTKLLNVPELKEKEYLADVRLGSYSSTDDEEGEKKPVVVIKAPERTVVEDALNKFVGRIEQVPPVYSAVKIAGREAYKLARKGQEVEMRPRPAEVKKIELLSYAWPDLRLRVVTGPGVYIRALARDIGRELKTGAYLSGLERTRVGGFTKETALSPEEAASQISAKLKAQK